MKKTALHLILALLSISFYSSSTFAGNKDKEEIIYGQSFKKADSVRFKDNAKIQILDKTTAKSQDLSIKIGQKIDYGNITIKIHKCWQAPLDQKPDSKILMEVFEKTKLAKTQNDDGKIFSGWMIASSPSVSGLEHPVYDIVALSCY